MRRLGASVVVVSSWCLLAALASCTDSRVVEREMELPLCPAVREQVDGGPPVEVAELGWLQAEEFVPLQADAGLCPGEPTRAVCPVFNSWKAVTSAIAVKARGPAPRGVHVSIGWELEGVPIDTQEFPSDLVCDGYEPVPLVLPIGFGQDHGAPEDYVCRPGRVRVIVAPAGVDPAACDGDECLVIERDVVYTLFGE